MMEDIGFNSWFKERMDHGKTDNFQIARIIAVNKDNFLIRNEKSEVIAELTGRLLFQAESPLDYPTVGDWVYVQYFNNNSFAVIDEIFPRKTVLRRKTSGKKIEFQLIAANIDIAMIIQSLDTNYNLRRLERYLAMINEGNIQPFVLLSKSDLLSPSEVNEKISEIHTLMPDIKLLAFSNLHKSGIAKFKDIIESGKTYCFLGSSGVGKTTLLNNLIGEELYKTQTISEKTNKGRHATTSRQLHILKSGAMIVDTPGMRELGNIAVESGLDQTFDEITSLTDQCRFNNCTHTNEDGCAVLDALTDGTISRKRYDSYLKMHKESAYYNMSYLEKRQKDKKFGKMYKSVMKRKVK
ncbi:MAG: ribosome small subunit-dependent GTPase A [Calditrichia bacterium]|jgi:ribosome biogenesis GTPase|nr:ribosome small subunit-dependent GTPase A [Calditrichia bacterium]